MDKRARVVVNVYSIEFKTLDVKFAADVVGDGEDGTKDPFETA